MLLRLRRVIAIGMVALVALPAHAIDNEPLALANLNPLVQIFGLPVVATARSLAIGETSAALRYEIANTSYYHAHGAETLALDGEVHRLNLRLARGTASGEWGIEFPYVSHDPGVLDSFIQRWHDTFGLPEGGRQQIPNNRLFYRYVRSGEERLHLFRSTEGIGDVKIYNLYPFRTDGTIDLTLFTQLKLPTGDADTLHGSGAADLTWGLNLACGKSTCLSNWAWNASAGAILVGKGDLLGDIQRPTVLYGNLGLHWRAMERTTLKASLYAHSAFYSHSDLTQIGDTAVQLLLGASWTTTNGTVIELGVSEDVQPNTAPDVGITLGLRSSY